LIPDLGLDKLMELSWIPDLGLDNPESELPSIPDLGRRSAQLGLPVSGLRFAAHFPNESFTLVQKRCRRWKLVRELNTMFRWDHLRRERMTARRSKTGPRKNKNKTESMLAASLSGTPLLEETEGRTGLLGPLCLARPSPRPIPVISHHGRISSISPLPWATHAEKTLPGSQK